MKWLADVCHNCSESDVRYHEYPISDVSTLITSCLENDDNTCIDQGISGYYTPGTFQVYLLTSASYATLSPEGTNSPTAAPTLYASLTVYFCSKKINATSENWVVVIGTGKQIGHPATQYASRGI